MNFIWDCGRSAYFIHNKWPIVLFEGSGHPELKAMAAKRSPNGTGFVTEKRKKNLLAEFSRNIVIAALCTAIATGAARAQGFQTSFPNAILVDAGSGAVLFEKAPDETVTPASTVKIMTAELVFRELLEGRLKLDDEFVVSEHAWRDGGTRAGGSSMFLQANSRVRVEDLIRGLVIDSATTRRSRSPKVSPAPRKPS